MFAILAAILLLAWLRHVYFYDPVSYSVSGALQA